MLKEKIFQDEEKASKDSKPVWKKKKVMIPLGVFLILAVIILARGRDKKEETAEETIPKSVSVIEILSGETKTIELEKSVKVTSQNEAKVIAEYSGRVKSVLFEVGDRVARGQRLAVFEDAEKGPSIDLDSAKDALEFAEDNLKLTKKSTDKDIKLAKNSVELAKIALENADDDDKSTAEENLEAAKRQKDKAEILAKQQIKTGKNSVELAQNNYDKAKIGYSKTIITAPVSGTIVRKNISQNSYLNLGSLIAVVGTSGELEARISLNKREVEELKVNNPVAVKCDNEYQNIGYIKGISNIADPDNSRYEVAVGFKNNNCIEVNKFITIKLLIPSSCSANDCFLPLSTVNIGQNQNTVFVVEDGIAKLRKVQTGKLIGELIQIREGINEGELVVYEGSKNLRANDKVIYE